MKTEKDWWETPAIAEKHAFTIKSQRAVKIDGRNCIEITSGDIPNGPLPQRLWDRSVSRNVRRIEIQQSQDVITVDGDSFLQGPTVFHYTYDTPGIGYIMSSVWRRGDHVEIWLDNCDLDTFDFPCKVTIAGKAYKCKAGGMAKNVASILLETLDQAVFRAQFCVVQFPDDVERGEEK